MTLEELQNWIVSTGGMEPKLTLLSRFAAAKSVGLDLFAPDLAAHAPDWRRLLFAGSILTKSGDAAHNEAALMIAHAGLLYSADEKIADASTTLLAQLANHRAIALAKSRGVIPAQVETRLGALERMLFARREFTQAIFLPQGDPITTNRFQRELWDKLQWGIWVSASGPTASGKTYLILRWLLNELASGAASFAIFLAPTRALVSEIEHELLALAPAHQVHGLRVASLPLAELGDRQRPTVLVFTQERLHVFLNSVGAVPAIDTVVVDEVHKLGDGLRGVILQDAIERVARANPQSRFVFLSPLTENPETLLSDAPRGIATAVVPSEIPTVTQNLIIAKQQPRDSTHWQLLLQQESGTHALGDVYLHARPDTSIKRLSYLALALGRSHTGTLVYANGPAEAAKIAWQIYNGLHADGAPVQLIDPELADLSNFARDTIHPQFQLVELVKRGVGFHFGNMPTLLRSEIERLFRDGKLRFLVCTSTLIEGVNLACRTIVMRGPRKGTGKPMGPHDFWNLAGRAGRWGQDFHGNIVCLDVQQEKLWPHGVPQRTRYPIRRETETVLAQQQAMLDYLDTRLGLGTASLKPDLEQVTAYLLAWKAREGSFVQAPSAARLDPAYVEQIDARLTALLGAVDVPADIIVRNPGVSAAALQSLLKYFRRRTKPVEQLLPGSPDSDDAYERLIAIFRRINDHLTFAFGPTSRIPLFALVTLEWMRGLPLGQIIGRRISYMEERDRAYELQALIRDTMKDVEETARFKAPKYLAAYLDVLKFHLQQIERLDLFPANLPFDLYLEFGVATRTLLSLIGIGLSRTSAVALNEFLADDQLTEDQLLQRLATGQWRLYDMPVAVKREIDGIVTRRLSLSA